MIAPESTFFQASFYATSNPNLLVLVVGGIAGPRHIELCERRGDAMLLFNPPTDGPIIPGHRGIDLSRLDDSVPPYASILICSFYFQNRLLTALQCNCMHPILLSVLATISSQVAVWSFQSTGNTLSDAFLLTTGDRYAPMRSSAFAVILQVL